MQIKSLLNKKWAGRAVWAALGVLVFWGIAWAVLPGIIKSQFERIATEQLGRKVSVGEVSLRPWTLELTLNDLSMAQADGVTPQVQIKRIYIDGELQSVLRLAPVVDALRVEGVTAKLTHVGNGRYDVDDILERLAAAPSEPKPLPRFALYNLALQDVSLDFVDQTVKKTHELRELSLHIPFLSNLSSLRDVKTEPRLAFRFNGSHFDSAAQTTPFAATRKTDASIHLKGLDVQPYLPYWPKRLPLQLTAGTVGLDVQLAFEQTSTPVVKLSGVVELKDVRTRDARSQDLLAFDSLRVVMDEVRPLEQWVKLASVELGGPNLAIRRDKAGAINVLSLSAGASVPAQGPPSPPPSGAKSAMPSPWKVAVAKIAVRTGQVHWLDDSIAPMARLDLSDLALDASALNWPIDQPVPFAGAFLVTAPQVQRRAGAPVSASRLGFSGTATERAAAVKLRLEGLPLSLANPYLAQVLEPVLDGRLSAEVDAKWTAPDLLVQASTLKLKDLTLTTTEGARKTAPLSVQAIELSGALVDVGRRTVALEKVAITKPSVAVTRGEDTRWMFENWLKPVRGPAVALAKEAPKPQSSTPPWRVGIKDFTLQGGAVQYGDRATSRPVALDVAALSLQMKNFATDGKQAGSVKLSARIKSRQSEPGQLDFSGALGMQPVTVQGKVLATHLPAHALVPYLGDLLNVRLLRADASFKGDVRYAANAAGPLFKLAGDALLEELLANSRGQRGGDEDGVSAQELLSWKALSLRGLDVAVAPGLATTVTVDETALTDFYARVIISETGRINLQDLMKPADATGNTAGADQTRAAPAAVIRMGPTTLTNGQVLFSDHFIQPNYTTRLTDLTGRLGAFSSVPAAGDVSAAPAEVAMADLELHGHAEGTASLEIVGKLNPLAKPLALDIKGKVRDLELAPLSPYSVKFAGHGIERGKLAMDVAYQVLPDGQLTAKNQLVLNQLTFGDKVENAPNSLPVRLAVALLADRNGVIDINLPINGSLNDPEFRIGPIIFKLIVNLIAKAVTSPFSLLSAALGGDGGEELGQVGFAPGSAVLSDEAKRSLDKVVGAMKERPSLNMTVVGTASMAVEREAVRREQLHALMQAEKRRVSVVAGKAVQEATPISEAEKPLLLKEVYQRARMPKPRNLLGLLKDLPVGEMEGMLLANMVVTEEQMRELALARGMAVKDYISGRELPLERLFLGAIKSVSADPNWSPRAELHLSLQ